MMDLQIESRNVRGIAEGVTLEVVFVDERRKTKARAVGARDARTKGGTYVPYAFAYNATAKN